jgi:hypothetical protein
MWDADHKAAATHQLVVGAVGALVNIIAIAGIWRRQRVLLLPVIAFLIVTMVMDIIALIVCIAAAFSSAEDAQEYSIYDYDKPHIKQEAVLKVSNRSQGSVGDAYLIVYPILVIRISGASLILRLLLDACGKDPTPRCARSPQRSQTDVQSAADVKISISRYEDKKESTPKKQFKYAQFK